MFISCNPDLKTLGDRNKYSNLSDKFLKKSNSFNKIEFVYYIFLRWAIYFILIFKASYLQSKNNFGVLIIQPYNSKVYILLKLCELRISLKILFCKDTFFG